MTESNVQEILKPQFANERIGYLIAGFLKKCLTPIEMDELEKWITGSHYNQLLFAELLLPYNIKSIPTNRVSEAVNR